ncbi:MAG: pyrroline-5-carboxylate reductase [Phycisphaerae bacterium]|nr:pyrroline-5-carboxylate reductase [Phycisphaerae bacterium]
MAKQFELGFIGAGNMAEGIAAGILQQRVLTPAQLIASDPVEVRRTLFAEQFSVATTDDNRRVVAESRCLMLAIKPQSFDEVMAPLANAITADHLLISIMAGMSTERIAAIAPQAAARVVRVMPNLPIRLGAGMAGMVGGRHARPEDIAFAKQLFDAGGQSVVVADESLLDAVTAVSGSGPAYFYYVVEAMIAGGVAAGLTSDDAQKLAEHTCLGAARMMIETGEPPAELRRKVTSKGGTTQAAIEHMENSGVSQNIREAVLAAARRSKELGK